VKAKLQQKNPIMRNKNKIKQLMKISLLYTKFLAHKKPSLSLSCCVCVSLLTYDDDEDEGIYAAIKML
jgi:hypothetical protein